jgi:hypothetical protein
MMWRFEERRKGIRLCGYFLWGVLFLKLVEYVIIGFCQCIFYLSLLCAKIMYTYTHTHTHTHIHIYKRSDVLSRVCD